MIKKLLPFLFLLLMPGIAHSASVVTNPTDKVPTGATFMILGSCPTGYLTMNGQSIGYSSGTYQGNRYLPIYTQLWSVAATSGNAVIISSSKGASAAADFAALKTITVSMADYFPRQVGTINTTIGAQQADAFKSHRHNMYQPSGGGSWPSTFNATVVASTNPVGTAYTDYTGDTTETRPMNIAFNFCMKLY